MDLIWLLDLVSEPMAAAMCGLAVGLLFGFSAQRSRFCLRAAAVEFSRLEAGPRFAVWLLTFATALVWTQLAALNGWLNPAESRLLSVPGSISGAVIGGLMFGVGMVMARGCSGRLLVLAATGNLRAVISGLVFAVFAQMSLHGWLRPVRDWLAQISVTPDGRNIDLIEALGLPEWGGLALGVVFTALALSIALRNRLSATVLFMGSGVGFAVAVGWVLTYALSRSSFEPVQVVSATFTGPSADTLMFFLSSDAVLDFNIGLIPGVFIGSFIAAALSGELKFQGFDGEASMRRYLAGAALMGFGGMLAGGCAIGNGVTGTSVMAFTSWIALTAMWVGAVVTDRLVDAPRAQGVAA